NRLGLDGKPRDLHVAESLRSINFHDQEPSLNHSKGTIADCPHFRVDQLAIPPGEAHSLGGDDQFSVITVVEGSVRCGSEAFEPGRFFLVPAAATLRLEAIGDEPARVLQTKL
ncbi:MAG: mannose-6-phosphate isomerase, partial [Verrucomicrobiota bacterium]